MERFKPKEAIDFVTKMLDGQCALSNTKIQVNYTSADAADDKSTSEIVFKPPGQNRLLSSDAIFPQLVGIQQIPVSDETSTIDSYELIGDQIRFKQILINLIKNSFFQFLKSKFLFCMTPQVILFNSWNFYPLTLNIGTKF